jgi:hypothetical protein
MSRDRCCVWLWEEGREVKERRKKKEEKGMHSRRLNRIAVVRWLNDSRRKRRLNQHTD